MKRHALILSLVLFAGCVTIRDWRARIEKPEAEQPEPEKPKPEPPEIAAVHLDYSRDWTLRLTGTFARSGRIIQNGASLRDGLDLFWWHGGALNLRLFNAKIRFTEAFVGDGYAIPRQTDHWAQSLPVKLRTPPDELVVYYGYRERRVRIAVNGSLILDFGFEILSMPTPRRELWLVGFAGEVVITP